MNNPILRNYRSRIIYASVWILLTWIQIFILSAFTNLPFIYIFLDAIIFNTLFSFLIIPLWYPVRFSHSGKAFWYSCLLISGLACILIFIWMLAGYLIMYIFTSGKDVYFYFFYDAMPWRIIVGILLYALSILVYYLCIHVEKLKEKAVNEIRLNKLLKDGELNLLKSQINPHFLFNSLNSVNALIVKTPEQAQEMLVALSEYLRYTVLATHSETSTLKEEIANIEHYLSIEKLRFGDKLTYQFFISPDCLPVQIPSMLLQPLFENAIKHGVYESTENVHIVAKAKKDSDFLRIEISNDFNPENDIMSLKNSGTGLKNIRERLRLMYGDAASLQVKNKDNIFRVILEIPFAIIS